MKIEIASPGKTLLALAAARAAISARCNQLANCSSCKEEDKARYFDAVVEIAALIKQIEEQA